MTNEAILQCFAKQPDGTWLCISATLIETPDGPLPIEPGARFGFGESHQGLDVAEYLEQLGAQFGS